MNEGIKKRNYIVYTLACIAICIFLLLIYFYDKATDTRQQQSAYAVTEWTDYTKNMYMKKSVVSGTLSVDASVGNDSPNGEWDSTNSALVAGTTYSYTIQQADDSSGNNATTILTGTFVA